MRLLHNAPEEAHLLLAQGHQRFAVSVGDVSSAGLSHSLIRHHETGCINPTVLSSFLFSKEWDSLYWELLFFSTNHADFHFKTHQLPSF